MRPHKCSRQFFRSPEQHTNCLHEDVVRATEDIPCAGLVTEVPAKLRVYILEYMAHLSLKDWQAVGDDFVKLQFVAEGSKHPNEVPGLMDSVGVILDLLMGGGGMQSLDKVKVRLALRHACVCLKPTRQTPSA